VVDVAEHHLDPLHDMNYRRARVLADYLETQPPRTEGYDAFIKER
jgi:hypothetical protein